LKAIIDYSERIFYMNYKLDEALLIVDAKGFPFREVQLRGDGVYGVCNPAAVSSVVTSHIR
jgi:hypothetical protein